MPLERLLWDEEKRVFVKFNKSEEVVNPIPIGFPTAFFVCEGRVDLLNDEEVIEFGAPKGAGVNAYCKGNIRPPEPHDDRLRRNSYEVQYYKI